MPLTAVIVDDEQLARDELAYLLKNADDVSVVAPDDISVIAPSNDSRLTLITCYPFHFIGPAPKRFVVTAHLVTDSRQ